MRRVPCWLAGDRDGWLAGPHPLYDRGHLARLRASTGWGHGGRDRFADRGALGENRLRDQAEVPGRVRRVWLVAP